ncbi:MAG TPA: metal ABC transporter ATP-binding protein [Bacteroidetes bacterium]|nr:metal ABC transporter ATP-binding protein [Bacteroidota bacterium]
MAQAAITLENVSVELGGRLILEDVTCRIEKGCLTGLMGPNGAGKTTLLYAILGLLPYKGRIRFDAGGGSRPRIGYVPQKIDLDRGAPITVRDFLVSGLSRRPLWSGVNKNADESCKKALDRVGVLGVFKSPLGRISGGELQRVLLAQALLGDPEILILDEPAAAVDISGEALFCDLLEEVHNDLHLTTLLVTHDLSVVATHAHFVLCLNRVLICAGVAREVLTQDNLRRVFSPHVELFIHKNGGKDNPYRIGHGSPD